MKKLPPWALVAIAVVAGALLWFIKRQRQQQKELAEQQEETQQQGATQYPESSEYEGGPVPLGGQGGGGLGGSIGTAAEYGQSQHEFEQQFTQENQEFQKQLFEQQQALATFLKSQPGSVVSQGSGGGAPSEGTRPGVVNAPPHAGAPTPTACPSSHPHYNPRKGPVGPDSCYAEQTCGNGCPGHIYQHGAAECQHKNSKGHCEW